MLNAAEFRRGKGCRLTMYSHPYVRRITLVACCVLLLSTLTPLAAQSGLPEDAGGGKEQGSTAPAAVLPPGAVSTMASGNSQSLAASAGAKLGRLVTISVGSFPFTWFYSNFLFDLVRFAVNDYDAAYAPWPFKSQNSAALESDETFMRLGAAVGASLVVGLVDLLL